PQAGYGGPAKGAVTALARYAQTALAPYPTFEHVTDLIRTRRDVKLLVEVETCLRLSSYSPGRIEFAPTEGAPADLAQRLGQRLQDWTSSRWVVTVVSDAKRETIAETRDAAEMSLREQAAAHPLVQAVLLKFPKAQITAIRTPDQIAAAAVEEALPEVEDEWDPFEDG
ncbi:MAG: DNA polymerase III subunit gamma/tau, partial [Rhodobacteraceae bacterium]|nr:DNA polymerase III subunit gamma/tau [Paracoccaceae bacterium]